ncbi:MAG: OmpH family outer membrane protein [Lentisphaeria bacterium]|nr:OmpH family outer membrane protein [Lentisphaeria bacterium]MBQ7404664.1 OmpH family outer membrane protein [Lentisphaeria bacterium]
MLKKMLLLLLLCCTVAVSAQQKIAVVDMDKLFREYYKTKIVEANLKRQADIYKEYAMKLQEEIRRLRQEYVELRDASLNVVLTEAARESKRLAARDKYNQILAKENELKNYNREKQAQLRDDQDKQRAKILEDIRTVVKNQAVLGGYHLVLDSTALSISGLPVLIYSEPAADITASVLKELNAGHRTSPAK